MFRELRMEVSRLGGRVNALAVVYPAALVRNPDVGVEGIAALGIRKGDEGIVRDLQLYNDTVFAFVTITYSTGQTWGWMIMEMKPDYKVRSFTTNPR